MKRHNLTEASVIPCYFSWSLICFLLVLCFFSCACRNKSVSVQSGSASNKTAPSQSSSASTNSANNSIADSTLIANQYSLLTKQVKARPSCSLFGEFLERGKFSNIFMGLNNFEYFILVPTDAEINKLDNATKTQLIYPEIVTQTNVDFMLSHVAVSQADPNIKKNWRTLANKSVSFDASTKNITIDNRQYPVIDEAILPPSIRIIFINNYLN